jgi:hypothetical protein
LSKQQSIYFQIQIKSSSTSYICIIYLHNISENKPHLYQIPKKISRNKIIPLIQKLTQLNFLKISSWFVYTQIYKLQRYGQYKMHGNVINVPANVDQIQSILSHLLHDGATICVFFKWRLEYKSFICQEMFVQIRWWLFYKI